MTFLLLAMKHVLLQANLFFKGSGSIKYSAILFVHIYECSCTLWPKLMPVFIYIHVLVLLFCVWLWYLIIYIIYWYHSLNVHVLVVLKIHIQIITAVHVHAQMYRQIILNVYMYMNLHTWHNLFYLSSNDTINQRVEISSN